MSMGWYLHAFERSKFDALVGCGERAVFERLVDSVGEDLEDAGLVSTAETIIMSGIDYSHLDRDAAETLDDCIRFLFEEEPLDNRLNVEPLNDGSIGERALPALLSTARSTSAIDPFSLCLLEAFCTGRRLGQSEPDDGCNYVVLSIEEIAKLLPAISEAIDAHPVADDPWHPDFIRDSVCRPLQQCSDSNRECVMWFG